MHNPAKYLTTGEQADLHTEAAIPILAESRSALPSWPALGSNLAFGRLSRGPATSAATALRHNESCWYGSKKAA